uniref:Probable disease resistance protein At1g58390 n=2 Tax=Nicotiana TaxID=4085 RepID=A0A1S3XLW2_TOBAC
MLESLHATAEYFRNVLEETSIKSRFDPEKVKSFEEKIRVAASDAEDVELKIWEIVKGSSWKLRKILQHEDLQPVVEKMDTTKKQVMEIVSNFGTSIHDSYDEIVEIHGDSLIGPPSRSNPMLPNLEDDIVQGLDDDLEIIVGRLKGPPPDLDIVTISGMGGIGKTTVSLENLMIISQSATSWKILRDKVFGLERDHPHELEETGKKIVEKCQGLPLTISVISGHLSKMARTLESWKDVPRTLGEIIASHPNKCLGVLALSYHHLPNRLKPCFLSMGSFPEDFEAETCKLIQLWIAEGFIRTSGSVKSLEEVAEIYLDELISRNLIMARKRRFNGEIKTCEMHDLLREFCLTEVEMT